jgi:membrane associated rhomboid family serine protease
MLYFAVFFLGMSVIYAALFAIPAAKDSLALDPARFFSGEFWRLFTYQFVHNTTGHLFENIIAFLLSIIIALELKTVFSQYYSTYFIAGIFAILPLWIISPFFALGASTAIYGGFGFLCRCAGRFDIKPYMVIGAIAGVTLLTAAVSYSLCDTCSTGSVSVQLMSHLAGLFFGYYFYLLLIRIYEYRERKKTLCLRALG